MKYTAIAAASENDVIGSSEDIPWTLRSDLRRFRELTSGHAVIVGRVTHDSIVARIGRPLPRRHTIVLSKDAKGPDSDSVSFASSAEKALQIAESYSLLNNVDTAYIAGGAMIYDLFLRQTERIELTRVHRTYSGDTYLPANYLSEFSPVQSTPAPTETGQPTATYIRYQRRG